MNKRITAEKLKVYQKYEGDIDSFLRIGSKNEKKLMGDKDWGIMDDFSQNIFLIKNHLASAEFTTEVLKNLELMVDEPGMLILLK